MGAGDGKWCMNKIRILIKRSLFVCFFKIHMLKVKGLNFRKTVLPTACSGECKMGQGIWRLCMLAWLSYCRIVKHLCCTRDHGSWVPVDLPFSGWFVLEQALISCPYFAALWNRASVLQTHNEDPLGLHSDADSVRHPLCASPEGPTTYCSREDMFNNTCCQVTSGGTVLELQNKDIYSCSGGHYAQRRNSSPFGISSLLSDFFHSLYFPLTISPFTVLSIKFIFAFLKMRINVNA